MDAAVTTAMEIASSPEGPGDEATMEMESYLGPTGSHVAHVNAARSEEHEEGLEVMAVARARGQDATMAMLQKICERAGERNGEEKALWRASCMLEVSEGHFARDCLKTKSLQQLGAVDIVIMQEDAAIITDVKSLEASESECHI